MEIGHSTRISSAGAAPTPSASTGEETRRGAPSESNNSAEAEAVSLTAEINGVVSLLKQFLPFLIVLLLRFLFAYLLKIIFLLFVFVFGAGLSSEFNHQISLKNLLNKPKVGVLFLSGGFFFMLIPKLTSFFFDEDLWSRYLLEPYRGDPHIDLISVLWLTCLTDLSVSLFLTTLKLGLTFALTSPPVASRDHSSLSFLAMLPSQLHHFSAPFLFRSVLRYFPLAAEEPVPSSSSGLDLESGMPIIEDSSHSTAASPSEAGGVLSSFFMSYGTARRRSGSSPTPNGPLPSQGAASSREPHLTRESSDDDRLSRHTEVSSYLRLKRLFSNVDLLSAVYRSLLPVPVWICYFVNGPGADYIPTYYLSVKLLNLFFLLRAIVVAIGNTLAGRTEYGRYSTEQEIQRLDSEVCTICFDNLIQPVTLPCRHVFCEHCVFEWLEKENTCPMCRAQVREGGSVAVDIQDLHLSYPIVM